MPIIKGKSNINIRKNQPSDKSSIVKCFDEFGDYLVSVDRMKRQRWMRGASGYFTRKMLEEVDKNNGLILVAEHKGRIIGFIAGAIRKPSKEDLLECVPGIGGRIIELFIVEKFRRQNIGTTLMKKMEEYFRQAGCDVSKVEVFAPNVKAHQFYRSLGYHDRSFDLIKKL